LGGPAIAKAVETPALVRKSGIQVSPFCGYSLRLTKADIRQVDHRSMTTAPDTNFPPDRDPEAPRWLGSTVRRGLAQEHGAGWTENEVHEEEARPKWLGSVARREGSRGGGESRWVDPEEAERPIWLGSVARRGDSARSLVLIDMEDEPSEPASKEPTETPQAEANPSTTADSSPGLKEILKPPQATDELVERRQPKGASGDLGMHLRVA
jgi:hypothetical protein